MTGASGSTNDVAHAGLPEKTGGPVTVAVATESDRAEWDA